MKFVQPCFGTKLIIDIEDSVINTEIVESCFQQTLKFESSYSRFIKNNFLSTLNTHKTAILNAEFLSLIQLCQRVSELSEGYFDITVLPILENLGYGIAEEKLQESIGYKNIILSGDEIFLKNQVCIDIGSVGKGYMTDKIYNILDKHYKDFCINFGGDIRIKGKKKIFLEDPMDDTKMIGELYLENLSIASSNSRKRKTKNGHHLINAHNKQSAHTIKTIFVTHRLSSFSDIFSTALFVSPLELSLKILNNTEGLEAFIITQTGAIYKSRGFHAILY